MLEQVLAHLHNWFETEIRPGTYTVSGGCLELPFLREGQYFRIVGSVFNDGVHLCPAHDLTDETFEGTVFPLAVPKGLLAVVEEIAAWQEKYGEAAASPYSMENFGGYFYSKTTAGGATDGITWQRAFATSLNPWRKV